MKTTCGASYTCPSGYFAQNEASTFLSLSNCCKAVTETEEGDNYHMECWISGGCTDDGASACSWCGRHSGQAMYCCNQGWTYARGHACFHGDFVGNARHHICVTP